MTAPRRYVGLAAAVALVLIATAIIAVRHRQHEHSSNPHSAIENQNQRTSPRVTQPPTTVPPPPVEPVRASRPPSGSITDLAKMPGDHAVIVPKGTYTAGEVTAVHPATGGPLKGWLVLLAESPGDVVIDQSPPGTVVDQHLNAHGDLVIKG